LHNAPSLSSTVTPNTSQHLRSRKNLPNSTKTLIIHSASHSCHAGRLCDFLAASKIHGIQLGLCKPTELVLVLALVQALVLE